MGGREWAAKWAEVQPDTLKMGQVEGQIKLKLNAVHILFNLSHAPLEKSNYYVLANTGGNSTVCLAAKQETCLPPPPPPSSLSSIPCNLRVGPGEEARSALETLGLLV